MHRRPGGAPSSVFLLLAFLAGAARAQNGSLVISDFDGDKVQTRAGLSMLIYADEQLGGTSEARPTLVRPGAGGSRGAMRIAFRVTDEFRSPFAGVWAMVGPEGLATDVSAYRGVRFQARSPHAGAFLAGVVRFPGVMRRYMTAFEVGPEWTAVELPFTRFTEVTPAGWPTKDAEALTTAGDVTSVGFSVAPKLRGAFQLDVDRLELYR